MWIWRKMEKITWKDKMSNKQVLGMVEEKRTMMNVIMERKRKWIGHILRVDGLLRKEMEGRILGKQPKRKETRDDVGKLTWRNELHQSQEKGIEQKRLEKLNA